MGVADEIRAAREATSIFRGLFDYLRDQENQLASEGRRSVLGGLLSKEPVVGTDTIRYEGILPMLANIIEPIARGVDAPRAAAQNLIPPEDMVSEAFGTAGAALVGSGAVAGRGILEYDPNTTRVFAGKRASGLGYQGRNNIKLAEDLFAQGAKNEDVYNQTGVFRGVDGKLRYELDDKASSVMDAVPAGTTLRLDEYLNHPELFKLYPSIRGVPVKFMSQEDMGGVRGSFSPSDMSIKIAIDDPEQMRSTLLHEVQHALQNYEGFSGGSSTFNNYSQHQAETFAGNLLSSPEAKNLYYQYQSFNQQYDQVRPLYRVQYIDKLNALSKKALDGRAKPAEVTRFSDWYKYGDKIRSNLGPMPKRPGPARDNWIASAAAQLRDFNLAEMSDFDRAIYDETRRKFDTPKDVQNAIRRFERKIEKHRPGAFEYRNLTNRAKEVQDLNAFDAYMREAGEVEARNVQSRLNPNNPQGFPLNTAEYKPDQQIVSSLRAGESLADVSSAAVPDIEIFKMLTNRPNQSALFNEVARYLESRGQ